jgi:hypothetical protein
LQAAALDYISPKKHTIAYSHRHLGLETTKLAVYLVCSRFAFKQSLATHTLV